MKEPISLRFKYSEEEYVAATRLYVTRSTDFMMRLVVSILYSIACIFLFVWLEFASDAILLLIFVSCLPLIIGLLYLLVMPRQRFRSDPKFRDEYFLQFSDDGIQFKTAQIDALVQWSLYSKVIENEGFYLLVYGKYMISVIPKRAFADANQEAEFRELLKRNLPGCFESKRLKGRKTQEPERTYMPPTEPPDWR
jgi:hypothetical protein